MGEFAREWRGDWGGGSSHIYENTSGGGGGGGEGRRLFVRHAQVVDREHILVHTFLHSSAYIYVEGSLHINAVYTSSCINTHTPDTAPHEYIRAHTYVYTNTRALHKYRLHMKVRDVRVLY